MSDTNSENLETENGNNGNNDPNGAGTDDNAGAGNEQSTDSADGRTIGSEDGASGGTSGGGGTDGGNGGTDGGGGDPDELGNDGRIEPTPLGSVGTEQSADDARSGGRRRRGRPAGSRGNRVAGSTTGTDRTTENTVGNLGSSDLNQGEPKKVKASTLLDESDTKLSKNEIVDIIGKTLQAVFFIPANFLGQDHWLLENSEAKELAGAIWDVIKTLPAKQGKRIDKFLKENAPYLKLAIVSGTILWSKISISIEISNLQRENAKLKENQNGNGFTANKSNANASPNGNGFPRGASWSDVINAGRGG